jgi:sugar phosphate permease
MPDTSSVPTTPKHSRIIAASPIYYGWIILLSGTLGMAMTTPGQTIGVSIFIDGIITDLGLSRSAVSLVYAIGTLGGSFTLPFVGRFIDHRGPRVAVVIIASLFALACVWMGFVQGLVTLLIGFALIRGLGQGSLGLVSLHVISIWFVRRRGSVIGLAGVGFALANSVFPPFIQFLISQVGWRLGYILLGGMIAVTILPIGALLYREHPERYGLLPDSSSPLNLAKSARSEAHYTLAQARQTPAFWLFSCGSLCVAALGTGLIFHHYSIMAASGVDRTMAAMMYVPLGIVMAGANLLTGFLLDRIPPRFLLSAVQLLLCSALVTATQVTEPRGVLVYGVLLGLMQGMSAALQAGVYAYYFGRQHLGSINGLATTIMVVGTAFGPILFALGFERGGNYTPVLLLSSIAPLLIAMVAPLSRPPKE